MEDQDYEDDEMSHASLSSGLSPRESRPRVRPWDLAEGYKVSKSQLDRYPTALNMHLILESCCACKHANLTHPCIAGHKPYPRTGRVIYKWLCSLVHAPRAARDLNLLYI